MRKVLNHLDMSAPRDSLLGDHAQGEPISLNDRKSVRREFKRNHRMARHFTKVFVGFGRKKNVFILFAPDFRLLLKLAKQTYAEMEANP